MKKQVRNDLLLKAIGAKLRQVRLEQKLSQEEVLFDTDIYLHRIETGSLNITVSTLVELCRNYHISMKELFTNLNYGENK